MRKPAYIRVRDWCTMHVHCTTYIVRTMYINQKHPSLLTSVSPFPSHANFMKKSNSEKNTDWVLRSESGKRKKSRKGLPLRENEALPKNSNFGRGKWKSLSLILCRLGDLLGQSCPGPTYSYSYQLHLEIWVTAWNNNKHRRPGFFSLLIEFGATHHDPEKRGREKELAIMYCRVQMSTKEILRAMQI